MKSRSNAQQQLGQLRARIEATVSEPAIIVVTSAHRGDGTAATAFGLARSLAHAEHRVLLVDANTDVPTLPRIHRMPDLGGHVDASNVSRYATAVAGERFDGISFADKRLEFGMSLDKAKAAAFDMRSHFDFVVVDAAQALESDLAVLFATIADATLITLRLGRLPIPADAEMMKTLSRVGASMLGVLTVTSGMIKEFATEREDIFQTVRVPARHVTTRHTLAPEMPREVVEPRSNIGS